jgi:hypothetical protein
VSSSDHQLACVNLVRVFWILSALGLAWDIGQVLSGEFLIGSHSKPPLVLFHFVNLTLSYSNTP